MLQYVARARCFYSSKLPLIKSRTSPPTRTFSIQTGDCQPPVDGTYHRSQVHVEDGRVFTFATVVSNHMEKGQSALPAWSHACSLLGTNIPTLAVAFVSKNTPSSAAAVEELGKSFTDVLTIENGGDPLPSKLNAPFVGCVADQWSVGAPASTSPGGGTGGGIREKRLGRTPAYRKVPVAVTGTGGETSCGAEDSEEEDFKALVGEGAKWTRENPGVVSDDEALVSLDKELKSRKADREKKPESSKMAQTVESTSVPGELKTTEGQAAGDVKRTGSVSQGESSEVVKGEICTSVGEAKDSEETLAASGDDLVYMKPAEAGGGSFRQTQAGSCSSQEGSGDILDDSYGLILCVAHMPGTKAVAFHTTTTGLPTLPDMEAAVTKNNPHMLLFGAPGYPFPEFVQRLSTVFPESCRAGAFLSPLYSSPRMQRSDAVDETKPLFAGAKQLPSGVVGLALSADGDGTVPTDAFTEFLRMSLGMARVPGHTFFDNTISNHLFFPKNVGSNRQKSPTSAPVDPNTLLKRLNTYLIRHSKVQSQTNAPASTRASGLTSSPTSSSIEVKSSYELQSSNKSVQSEEAGRPLKSEGMPLALIDTALFPGWSMPLHIYEPRYRHLVRHCVEEGKPFGLTSYWHWQNTEELIGTMANLKVYLFEKDCRSYVVAHGVQRFRVLFDKMWVQPGTFGLNMGQVEFFDENEIENKEELLELAKQVVDRCRQLIPEAEAAPGLVGSITDPTKASFAVGQLLPVPVRVKKRWLGMADTKFRLLEQMTFLNS